MTIVNVGHPAGSDDLERALTATMRAAGLQVLRYPTEETNTLLVGSASPVDPALLGARAGGLPPDLRLLATEAAAGTGPALRRGRVFTDDRAPVEWLVDASIVSYAAGRGD